MSHLTYSSYDGYGQRAKKDFWYSQAVRIGDKIECSGQGGWDRETAASPSDIAQQIAQAFANVEHTLKTAGGSGWSQVYKVRSYHVGLGDDTLEAMVAELKRYCPDHQPLWTCIGVEKLGMPDMKVEIEVKAHAPQ